MNTNAENCNQITNILVMDKWRLITCKRMLNHTITKASSGYIHLISYNNSIFYSDFVTQLKLKALLAVVYWHIEYIHNYYIKPSRVNKENRMHSSTKKK